jgi:hypothetical protein
MNKNEVIKFMRTCAFVNLITSPFAKHPSVILSVTSLAILYLTDDSS